MLAVAFVAVNLLTLIGLLARRYYRLFPWFCAALAAIVWQAGVTLWLPSTSRLNRYVWAPGEALAILLMATALLEAVWTSVAQLPHNRRLLTFCGLLVGCTGLTVDAVDLPAGDWYAQFLALRSWIWLGFALLAICGLWFGMAANRIWPRVARMHMGLMAMATAAHALFGSLATWHTNNVHYRLLEMACCGGWLINSGFLSRELASIQTSDDALLRIPAIGRAPRIPNGRSAFQGR